MRFSSHRDTGIGAVATREANEGVKHALETQASQQSAKKGTRYTNFSDTDRAARSAGTQNAATMHVLVKIEGGAKIGTAHSQR